MATLTRPRMGSRAISDMNPLLSPSPSSDKDDLGRGTQAKSGGAKVTSCSRTALGGIAPLSPFLPLPPAPTSEELQRQHRHDNTFLDISTTPTVASHVRFASSLNNDAAGKKSRVTAVSNAPHMIRSYSLPVATQRDFEAQQQKLRLRQQRPSATHQNKFSINIHSNANANVNANTMTSSKSSMGVAKTKHQLHCSAMQASEFLSDRNATTSRPSSCSSSRSALSTLSFNDVHSRNGSNEMDTESGSDEAEVTTPRAFSPATSTDYFTKANSAPAFDELSFFIHPSHLQPPVGYSQ